MYFRLMETQSVSEKRNSLLDISRSDSFVCPSIPDIDNAFLDNAVSPARLVTIYYSRSFNMTIY